MTFTQLEEFHVIGIGGRTNNASEMSGEGIISGLWRRAFGEAVFDKIPNRVDADVIALYSDYAGDEHGDYSFLIGARVQPGTAIPDGMTAKTVPAGRCAIFTSERGPASMIVLETWQRIWSRPRSAEYARSYRADFEVYGREAKEPENAQVDIYVGVE